MKNAGDSPVGRMKAAITRRTRAGVKPVTSPTPMVATKMSEPITAPPKGQTPRLKPYKGVKKFMGSFKYGGPVHRTGIYLLHRGEHVKSPYKRSAKGLMK